MSAFRAKAEPFARNRFRGRYWGKADIAAPGRMADASGYRRHEGRSGAVGKSYFSGLASGKIMPPLDLPNAVGLFEPSLRLAEHCSLRSSMRHLQLMSANSPSVCVNIS